MRRCRSAVAAGAVAAGYRQYRSDAVPLQPAAEAGVSLLVGAGLGLVGVLFQQVLRNPLAEPTTLGVATGAQLGMTVTTLWAIPGVLASQFAALAGPVWWARWFWRLVGQTPFAGNADSGRAGGQPVLRGA
jgi:ABC-type enterobactin transport system permease subunit